MGESETIKELLRIGGHLVAALSEEASLRALLKRRPDDLVLVSQLVEARHRVDQLGEEYVGKLDSAGYPELKFRTVLEA